MVASNPVMRFTDRTVRPTVMARIWSSVIG